MKQRSLRDQSFQLSGRFLEESFSITSRRPPQAIVDATLLGKNVFVGCPLLGNEVPKKAPPKPLPLLWYVLLALAVFMR